MLGIVSQLVPMLSDSEVENVGQASLPAGSPGVPPGFSGLAARRRTNPQPGRLAQAGSESLVTSAATGVLQNRMNADENDG